jgi:hypothetical protein
MHLQIQVRFGVVAIALARPAPKPLYTRVTVDDL